VDVGKDKLALARALGAEIALDARGTDPAAELQRLIGGAHGALVTAVSPAAFRQAVGMLRSRGTCVFVGLPPGELATPIFDVVLKRLTLRGSIVGTRMDLKEALQIAVDGRIQPTIELKPLSAVNETFTALREGTLRGRVVLAVRDP
jgi:propanol-preferring alcohol dehydrogenase